MEVKAVEKVLERNCQEMVGQKRKREEQINSVEERFEKINDFIKIKKEEIVGQI